MQDDWTEKLSCAISCHRCEEKMDQKDPRILSVYDHEAICMACKKEEEQRPDAEDHRCRRQSDRARRRADNTSQQANRKGLRRPSAGGGTNQGDRYAGR